MRIPASARVLSALILLGAGGLPGQGFVDITAAAGVGTPANLLGLFGRGACCGDFDGDGDQDLVVPGGGGLAALPVFYFRNDGNNVFTDLTATAGLGLSVDPHAVIPADVDNDGDLDIFIGNGFAADQLFINDGTGIFTEEGMLRGVASTLGTYSGSFGDYDRDGLLDLYVGGRHSIINAGAEHNRLLHNQGGGFFVEVTQSAGADNLGFTCSAPFVDYNQDGWPDIFVANDAGNPPSALLENNGDGTFTDVSASVGAQLAIDGMGVDFADVFNRGAQDFYITDTPPNNHLMVWNTSSGAYQDETLQRAVPGGFVGWGAYFMDYDNDTWQDLFVVHATGPNHMYRHPGGGIAGGPWTQTASALGLNFAFAQLQFSAVLADFDDDGRLDLYHLLPGFGNILTRNTVAAGNWLKVKTRGTLSNRDGIGARITLTLGTARQTRHVTSGMGYLSGSDMRCHFGLGNATSADRIDILWPSGQRQVFTNVPANQILEAVEPRYQLLGTPLIGTSPLLDLQVPSDGGLVYQAVVSVGMSPGIPLPDGRIVPVNPDWLLFLGLNLSWPVNGAGALSIQGAAQLSLPLPNAPSLVGFTFHSSALTLDPNLPELIRTILQPLQITLQ